MAVVLKAAVAWAVEVMVAEAEEKAGMVADAKVVAAKVAGRGGVGAFWGHLKGATDTVESTGAATEGCVVAAALGWVEMGADALVAAEMVGVGQVVAVTAVAEQVMEVATREGLALWAVMAAAAKRVVQRVAVRAATMEVEASVEVMAEEVTTAAGYSAMGMKSMARGQGQSPDWHPPCQSLIHSHRAPSPLTGQRWHRALHP